MRFVASVPLCKEHCNDECVRKNSLLSDYRAREHGSTCSFWGIDQEKVCEKPTYKMASLSLVAELSTAQYLASKTSEKKQEAARLNGRKGGRPKKVKE